MFINIRNISLPLLLSIYAIVLSVESSKVTVLQGFLFLHISGNFLAYLSVNFVEI